jgi:hypothetical protein
MKSLALCFLLVLTGCADPARNLYEGIKQNNDARRTPMERSIQPAPDYDTYHKTLDSNELK